MKELVLKQYMNYERHDESLTVDDVAFLHEIVRDDFTKLRPTKIAGTYAEVTIIKEVKQWYELENYEFMVTHITEKGGKTRTTVELSGVA
jgi:hypothetical protein